MDTTDIKLIGDILQEVKEKNIAAIIVWDVASNKFKVLKMPVDKIHNLRQKMGIDN